MTKSIKAREGVDTLAGIVNKGNLVIIAGQMIQVPGHGVWNVRDAHLSAMYRTHTGWAGGCFVSFVRVG